MLAAVDIHHIDAHLKPVLADLRSMRLFVTGSHSWFGKWICDWLDHAGVEYGRWVKPYNIFAGGHFDAVIHLAVCDIEPVIEFALRHDAPVLFTSTGGVYDPQPQMSSLLKIKDELTLTMSGLPYRIARCFSFIGDGIDDDLAAGVFIHKAIKGDPLTVWGDGMTQRSYMYMADLVIWLLTILIKGENDVYDVGGNIPITIRQLARFTADQFEPKCGVVFIDRLLPERNAVYVPDSENYKRALDMGLRTWVTWKEAIRRTIADELPRL